MQLTSHTDYALRLIMYLMLHEDERVSVKQIASIYDISTHHLSKVARELTHLGWIESHRGNQGGLSLVASTTQLTVGTVVRTLEHNLRIVECFGPQNTCPLAPACALKRALYEASEAFLSVLDGYPLHTLVMHPERLHALLDTCTPPT